MRKLFLFFILSCGVLGTACGQAVPELMYYKFDAPGTTVANDASAPVGNNPATVIGLTIGGTGQFGTGLQGAAGATASNRVDPGWTGTHTGSWTISFWMNVPPPPTTRYMFGNSSGNGTFRCFIGGAAQGIRLTGGVPSITLDMPTWTSGASVVTYVYDQTLGTVSGYINGVFQTSASPGASYPLVGTNFVVGSQGTSIEGIMDEFRMYNRALSAAEVAATWNITLPGGPCTDPPNPGIAVISNATPCSGQSVGLSLTGNTYGTGQTYQWESAPTPAGPWTPIGSPASTASTSVTPPPGTTTYYQAQVSCGVTTLPSAMISATVPTPFPGGTYTINSAVPTGGSNFQSFTDAMSAIGCGISGPVVFNVAPGSGPYTEQIIMPNTLGSNAINTVKINGNGAIVQHSAQAASTAVLMMDGVDYVKIDSLVFKSMNAANGTGAMLYNGCDFDTITRCTFDLSSVTGTVTTNHGVRITTTPTTTSTTASGADNLYFANNTIIGSTIGNNGIYYGIYAYGPNTNNIYHNNTIRNCYLYSMYVYYGALNVISNNSISRQSKTGTGYCYGMVTGFLTGGSKVINNRIEYLGGASDNGAYCYPLQINSAAGTVSAPVLVANNMVGNMTSVPLNGGIYINAGTYINVFHNTVEIKPVMTYSSTTVQSGIQNSSATANIQNNIVSYTGGGPNTKYGLYYGTTPATSNYNNVYMNSAAAGVQNYGYRTSAYATLSAFQSATSLELNGFDLDPVLTLVNGVLTPANGSLDNMGVPQMSVPDDILGNVRNASTPDMGVVEFVAPTCSVPTGIVSGGATTSDITVNWTASISNPVLGYEYYYNTTNVAPTTATIPSGSVAQGVTTTTITGLPPATTHFIWVRSSCGGNDYSYWSGPLAVTTLITNDEAFSATPLTVNPDYNCGVVATGTTIGATQSIDPAPSCNPTGINDDVWYSFTATSTDHRITLYGLNNIMSVALYTGSIGSLTQVPAACGATTAVLTAANLYATGLSIGLTYYVRVYTNVATAGVTSNFTICVGTLSGTPPPNDPCTNSVDITNGQLITGTVAEATQTVTACNGAAVANDVWYHFTTGNTGGSVTVTVVSTYADVVLEAMSGVCGGVMTGLIPTASTTATGSCIDGPAIGTEFGTYTVAPNTTYFVRLYGYNADQGTFTIQATGTPLSVKLTNIAASNVGARNRVDWTTAEEQKGDMFVVERSLDGNQFTSLTTVNAKGQSAEYSYWDETPAPGINYYRLKMVDAAGNVSYSRVVNASVKTGGFTVQVYPNPVSDVLTVKAFGTAGADPVVHLTDVTAKLIKTIPMVNNTATVKMTGLSHGLYLIRYVDGYQSQTIKVNKL